MEASSKCVSLTKLVVLKSKASPSRFSPSLIISTRNSPLVLSRILSVFVRSAPTSLLFRRESMRKLLRKLRPSVRCRGSAFSAELFFSCKDTSAWSKKSKIVPVCWPPPKNVLLMEMSAAPSADLPSPFAAANPIRKFLSPLLLAAAALLALLRASMSDACKVALVDTFPETLAALITVGLAPAESAQSNARSLSVTVTFVADEGIDSLTLMSSVLRPVPLRVVTGVEGVSVTDVEPPCAVILKWLAGILSWVPTTVTSEVWFDRLSGILSVTSSVFCGAPVLVMPPVLRTTLVIRSLGLAGHGDCASRLPLRKGRPLSGLRSEEHTSELQSRQYL